MQFSAKTSAKQLGILTFLTIGTIGSLISNTSAAHTEPEQSAEEHITLSAATEFNGVQPGESGLLAITLHIEEDWHTYWPGVSDSGFGVTLDIRNTGSITLDEPIWPTPHRYIQPGDILDHVYEDTATILVPFHVDEDAPINEIIIFDIGAEFLVCSDICLPGKASTSTSITIMDESSERSPTKSAKEIRKAYDNRPKAFNPKANDVRVQWIAKAAAIMFRDAKKIEFFPSTECSELAEPITSGSTDSNRLIIKFMKKDDKVLAGRFRVHERNKTVDYDIHLKAKQ
ncbi:MAG: hypothetical protein JKX70_09730 [Phycisphaerales bacterium]|nr:hypothetical protein [Phycisphaerales bacterium]